MITKCCDRSFQYPEGKNDFLSSIGIEYPWTILAMFTACKWHIGMRKSSFSLSIGRTFYLPFRFRLVRVRYNKVLKRLQRGFIEGSEARIPPNPLWSPSEVPLNPLWTPSIVWTNDEERNCTKRHWYITIKIIVLIYENLCHLRTLLVVDCPR